MTLNKKSERETESRGGCQNVLLKKKEGDLIMVQGDVCQCSLLTWENAKAMKSF